MKSNLKINFLFNLGVVLKSIMDGSSSQWGTELNAISPADSVLVAKYKELIRNQDMQIQTLNQTVEALSKEKHDLEVNFAI